MIVNDIIYALVLIVAISVVSVVGLLLHGVLKRTHRDLHVLRLWANRNWFYFLAFGMAIILGMLVARTG